MPTRVGRSDKERLKDRSEEGRREVGEDKRMALGRFMAGWLLQIRQVRCFEAKERHRSLATWWRGGQRPPDEVRGGEHSWRWATAGDFAADLPKVLAVHPAVHSLRLMRRAAIHLFVPRRYRQEFLSTPLAWFNHATAIACRPSWLMCYRGYCTSRYNRHACKERYEVEYIIL